MARRYYFSKNFLRLACFPLIQLPIIAIIMGYVIYGIYSLSLHESGNSEMIFYLIAGSFAAIVIGVPLIAWRVQVNRNKKKAKAEKEIFKAFTQQTLTKYLSQFPEKNRQEFLNYLAQCPEEKRQEILLKILREYGMSADRK